MGVSHDMDDATRNALKEIVVTALQPLQAQLARLNAVLLEGDDELGIPSLVRRMTRGEERQEEIRRELERRVRRLELGATTALVIIATTVAAAVSPGLVATVANLVRLIGVR